MRQGQACDGQHREADLQTAAQKDRPLQAVEGVARKFHADGEKEQGHADFRHMVDGLAVAHHAQQRGAAEYAGEQKAHGGGQFYFIADDGDHNGKQKDGHNLVKQRDVHAASVRRKIHAAPP